MIIAEPLQASYRISERDHVHAMRLAQKMPRTGLVIFAVVVLLLNALLWFGPPDLRDLAISLLIGCLTIVVLLLGWRVIGMPWSVRRNYRSYKAAHQEFVLQLFDDGLQLESGEDRVKLPWDHILKWHHNDKYLLLFLSRSLFYIVPKTIDTESFPLERLLEQLSEHVGHPSP